MPFSRKARLFWPVVASVFLTDCATKAAAERYLAGTYSQPVLGDFLRATLTYNQSAAMGLDLGALSRPVLILIASIALAALYAWYRKADPQAGAAAVLPIALVLAGAAGNLWDRLRGTRGVVDFIDVGLGASRFWVFNVADVAITLGGCWLAFTLARQHAPEQA